MAAFQCYLAALIYLLLFFMSLFQLYLHHKLPSTPFNAFSTAAAFADPTLVTKEKNMPFSPTKVSLSSK
jgi:hypothetical protein